MSRIEIKSSEGKGRGAYATAPFESGEIVGYYIGEFLTGEQVLERYPLLNDPESTRDVIHASGCVYLFALDEEGEAFVDGRSPWLSNWCRYINHSPSGNLSPFRDEDDPAGTVIYFQANRHIERGEELLFDYGESYWDGVSVDPI